MLSVGSVRMVREVKSPEHFLQHRNDQLIMQNQIGQTALSRRIGTNGKSMVTMSGRADKNGAVCVVLVVTGQTCSIASSDTWNPSDNGGGEVQVVTGG